MTKTIKTRASAKGLARTATFLATTALAGYHATSIAAAQQEDVYAPVAIPESMMLGEVVVTATGSEQTVPEAPATVSVIDGEEINDRAYQSVADVVRYVPGVVVNGPSSRSGAPSISIRGLGQDYVLFMVDSKPVGNSGEATYNGFGSGLEASYLPPPSAIERIEVIRGPMSSLYGTDALGGVINVITKPVSEEWTGTITTGVSAYEHDDAGDAYEGRFYVSGPLKTDVLGLSLYGSIHDRIDRTVYDGRSGEPSLQTIGRDNLGGRLTWSITEDQTLSLDIDRNVVETESNDEETISAEHMNYGLTHDLTWGAGYDTTSYVNYEDTDFTNGDNVSSYSQLNLNTKTAKTLGDHDITVGLDYRDEETRHASQRFPGSDPDMKRWNFAAFAEDNWHILDNFTATIGARYDENQRYGSHFTPRLYGVWDATSSLIVKGGVSGGYKVPELKQADSGIFEPAARGRAWDQGNTDLKPEESTNYEVGFVWLSELGFQFGVTAYHTEFTDKIDRVEICNDPVGLTCRGRESIRQYVNYEAAELNGVEATLDFATYDVDWSVNYTYSDSEITEGEGVGERFNDLPEHVANLTADWYATEDLSLWGRAQYRSEEQSINEDRIPAHVVVDLGASYDFNEHLEGNVAVYNVGDKRFEDNAYLDGRQYFVSLTGRF